MAKTRRKSAPPARKSQASTKTKAAPKRPKASSSGKRKPAPKATKPAPKGKVAPAKGKPPARTTAKRQTKVAAPAPARPAPRPAAARAKAAPPPQPPPRRSTYVDAVAQYERGVQFLQARRFREAADTLKGVIAQFPEEKELHERAQLYIRICERALAAEPPKPETADDQIIAATLALNNGSLDVAMGMLTAVLQADPENDHAVYVLGVACALKGHYPAALQHLSRAMALNPENRDLAFKEPDLEALRRTEDMQLLLANPPAPVPRRERPSAGKARR